jgi:glycosyltransferase involved in cell wall biosynthesis
MAVSATITYYTNPDEYEFIVVDSDPMKKYVFKYKPPILVGKAPIEIDKFLELIPDPGYYAAMNIGAKQVTGKYLCFIENDVFVTQDWLPNLRWYLENNIFDAIFPHQSPDTYKNMVKYCQMDFKEAINPGCEEQGLVLITREAFDKIGGWDKNLTTGYGWRRFLEQMNENKIRFGSTVKSTIIHIAGMTYFDMMFNETDKHNKNQTIENSYLNK